MKKRTKTKASATSGSFLKLGGDPVLDFCNTIVSHGDHQEERFGRASDVAAFWVEFFAIEVELTTKQFEEILKLRSELRALFNAIVDSGRLEEHAEELSGTLRKHPFVFQLEIAPRDEDGVVVSAPVTVGSQHLAPILFEVHRFLNALRTARLKRCANQDCSHLFYDVSKNNARVWCSMKTCGNLMKARAFYSRKKGA